MNTTDETRQCEMVNEFEPATQTEELDEKELEKRATETIVALVNQANVISVENSSIE